MINFALASVFASPKFDGLDIELENAGYYLKKEFKSFSEILWGLGLVASGISSTATGALTG